MVPLPYQTFVFRSRYDVEKLTERIERALPRTHVHGAHFKGTVDESGFDLHDAGVRADRKLHVFRFRGTLRPTEDGTEVVVQIRPTLAAFVPLPISVFAFGRALGS